MKTYPDNAFKKEYKSLYVHQLSIADSKRKRGYGSKLMQELYKIQRICL
ncbi:GNAT family N-acetyltransferase [Priestia megaterium]|nr:GNAT family N-acetyltransferase [Priestia megaterium]